MFLNNVTVRINESDPDSGSYRSVVSEFFPTDQISDFSQKEFLKVNIF